MALALTLVLGLPAGLLIAFAPDPGVAAGTGCLNDPGAPGAVSTPDAPAPPDLGGSVVVAVNQIGYPIGCAKQAVVMADHPLREATFRVVRAADGSVALRGRLGPRRHGFNARYRYVYDLGFDRLREPGAYFIEVFGGRSQRLRVDTPAALYEPLVAAGLTFFQTQRDGPDVIAGALGRAPSHLRDATAGVYAAPRYSATTLLGRLVPTGAHVDVAGGWLDAGDYLKFVETASFNLDVLEFAMHHYPSGIPDPIAFRAEIRFGIDWLEKMWDQSRRVLYYQVGIGDGNGATILGDHDLWRLPQADDQTNVAPGNPAYFAVNRPVFAANAPGMPISPNLAGRVAAAFGLCAQIFAATDPAYAQRCLLDGQTVFDLAQTHRRGPLLTSSPTAYYSEPEWRDDLELGAIELLLGTRSVGATTPSLLHREAIYYLPIAGHWADAYASNPSTGTDSLNLYDVSTLADFDLIRVLREPPIEALVNHRRINVPTDPGTLLADRRDQLALFASLGAREAFGLANPSTNLDPAVHALGYAIEARLYDTQAGRAMFEATAERQMNWVLGANPWGSSFVVGEGAVYPHCLASQIANLAGSLDGLGRIMVGATVDGSTDASALAGLGTPDGARPCPVGGHDPFASLVGEAAGYRDDVRSPATSEPADDFTALMMLAAAQQAAGA